MANIPSQHEKNPREKPSMAVPPRVFHLDFALICWWIFGHPPQKTSEFCPIFRRSETQFLAENSFSVEFNMRVLSFGIKFVKGPMDSIVWREPRIRSHKVPCHVKCQNATMYLSRCRKPWIGIFNPPESNCSLTLLLFYFNPSAHPSSSASASAS